MSALKRLLSAAFSAVVSYGYLLRVPLLTAAAVVGIYVAAFFTRARPLLANAFDVSWPWGIFLLSFTAFLTAWVVMVTWRLVLLYSAIRFGIRKRCKVSPNVKWWHVGLSSLIAFPIVCGAVYYSTGSNAREIAEAVLGALAALLVLGFAAILQKVFTPRRVAQSRPSIASVAGLAQTSPDMFIPSQGRFVGPLFDRARQFEPRWTLAQRITATLRELFSRVPKSVGRGYFKYDREGRVASILPGHSAAFILFVLTLFFYALIGIGKFMRLREPPLFPTLAYILLLLILLCWGLSGLAFFFDRFRIPVLIPLLLLLFGTSMLPWSDHLYPVTDRQPSPTTEANPTSDGTIIVVAANGGGIQAGAWTARVLTGLEQELGDSFGRSLRVVSSVSGGSVGAMYFVNEYTQDGPPSGGELDKIVERAEGSSLDKIAWGLVYPDFIRPIFPFYVPLYEWDRGRALEEAWLREDTPWDNRDNVKAGLSKWREDVAAGWRPGSIFNTTITDTGERLPLSTIDLPAKKDKNTQDLQGKATQDRFFETLNGKDIPVLTATRLSASFPYISPAARANTTDKAAAHIVDGGYYDNYGISSLVEWLDAELEKGNIKKVLVVQIHGAPTGIDNYQLQTNRGWFYQTYAPVGTLLHVRDTGQLSHNDVELKLLIDKWEEKHVDIEPVVFEFKGTGAPLSWHLNDREKEDIEQEWEHEQDGSKKQKDSDKSGLVKDPDKSGLEIVKESLQ